MLEKSHLRGNPAVQTLSTSQHQTKKQRKKLKYHPWEEYKYKLPFLIMSQDSETISLDLANDLPQEEENETQHKEPTTKSIDR